MERLGMQTRLTPLAFAAASFLAEQKPASAATRWGVQPSCLMRFDRGKQQVRVAGPPIVDLVGDDDLVLRLGCTPHLVAADAGFYSAKNEAAAKAKGVKRVCIPNRSTKSPERKREQKKRWFRNGQKWRTGCEGRISVVKRRHGLGRSRYKGDAGIKRWVGLGLIADNLVNISRVMAKQPSR